MKKIVAIITARGGSKRIPRKNIKHFCGKPILHYSIDAAIKSGLFADVMVSTDDLEIKQVALAAGATVPFLRSPATSDDFATTADVLSEVLTTFQKNGASYDYACCLYPTAPFITEGRLIEAFGKLQETDADSVIPVTAFGFPIWRAFGISENKLHYVWPENQKKRSQDLTPAYHDCGQFYFFNVPRFLNSGLLVTKNTVPIVVPETEVQDIDTMTDWKLAELKFKLLNNIDREAD